MLHGNPFNTFMFIDMLNEPFMHQQHVWPTRYLVEVSFMPVRLPISTYIGMNRHWEYEFVIFPIEIVEMVLRSVLATED